MHIPSALLLLPLVVLLCEGDSSFCVRHVKFHFVSRDDYDLGYLNRLYSITEALLQEESISKTSADIMKRTLSFSAHTLCEPGHAESRDKRQVVSGLIGLMSGLVVPHIFHALIYPSGSASEISRFRSFAMKTRGMARLNEHKIYDLEQRINRLQRREDLNVIFDNTMQNLQLEEMQFSELINNGPKFSTTLYNMLKPAIVRYKRLNIVDSSGRHSLNKSPLIPASAIHVNVSTYANVNCDSAFVNISVYTPIPSNKCEDIYEMFESYIVTRIQGTNDCRVLAPLRALVLLPDKKSYLALSNHFISPDCKMDNFDFNFSDNLRTLFAVPKKRGGIVATCGSDVHRKQIQASIGVAPAASCSSYISSGHLNPNVKDLFQPGTWLLNSQGDYLDASTMPALDFSFLDTATTTTEPSTTTTTAAQYDSDFPDPSSPSKPLWFWLCPIAMMLLLVCSCTVALRRRRLHKKKYMPERQEKERRLKIEDIEVIGRPQPDNELTLDRLHKIGLDLESTYKPQLLSMKSLKSLNADKGSVSTLSSISESTVQDYEAPNEM